MNETAKNLLQKETRKVIAEKGAKYCRQIELTASWLTKVHASNFPSLLFPAPKNISSRFVNEVQ